MHLPGGGTRLYSRIVTRSRLSDLNDAELADATLLVMDAASLAGALSSRPPAGAVSEIDVEYSLPPSEEAQRYCFCRSHMRHRKGFLTFFGNGDRYLVGSSCGPKHLGLEFSAATGTHSKLKDRQATIRRLRSAADAAEATIAWCGSILFGQELRRVETTAEAFRRLAGDAFLCLRAFARNDGQLRQGRRTRDLVAEADRDKRLPEDQTGGPIYRYDEIAVGRLRGVGLFQAEELRDAIFGLKQQTGNVRATYAKLARTDETSKLRRVAGEFERAAAESAGAADNLREVHQFFDRDHLEIVIAWAANESSSAMRLNGADLVLGSAIVRRCSHRFRLFCCRTCPVGRYDSWVRSSTTGLRDWTPRIFHQKE